MDNHLHVLLLLDPDVASGWSDAVKASERDANNFPSSNCATSVWDSRPRLSFIPTAEGGCPTFSIFSSESSVESPRSNGNLFTSRSLSFPFLACRQCFLLSILCGPTAKCLHFLVLW